MTLPRSDAGQNIVMRHTNIVSASPSQWRAIVDYEGRYEVSIDGQVRNALGVVLRPYTNNKGYLAVSLRSPKKNFLIHRLVAAAFIRQPAPGEQVNHIDFDKTNNRVENLEWCLQSHNMRHYYDVHGYPVRHGFALGQEAHNRKLTSEQVKAMRALLATGMSFNDASMKFGVSIATAYRVGSREHYAEV